MMRVPIVFDLFSHEAMPEKKNWWTYCFDTRPHMLGPWFLAGICMACYLAVAVRIVALGLFFVGSSLGGDFGLSMRSLAIFLEGDVADTTVILAEAVTFLLYLFVAENVVRVVFDVVVGKAFQPINSDRFRRAAIAAAILAVGTFVGVVMTENPRTAELGLSRMGFYFSVLIASAFFSLSVAIREGVRLREEQDLTI